MVTSGGDLKAKYVIHAVGPRWGEGDEETKLRNATRNALQCADETGINSITFPAISSGIFGFPLDLAAKTMLRSVRDYLSGSTAIRKVIFALFDEKSVKVFEENLVRLTAE